MLWRSSRERPENVLGMFRISLQGTSLERHIRTSPGRHFRTSDWHFPKSQTRMSSKWSNRISRGRPMDVGGGHPRDVLGTNICRVGINPKSDVYQRRSASMVWSIRFLQETGSRVSVNEDLAQELLKPVIKKLKR